MAERGLKRGLGKRTNALPATKAGRGLLFNYRNRKVLPRFPRILLGWCNHLISGGMGLISLETTFTMLPKGGDPSISICAQYLPGWCA